MHKKVVVTGVGALAPNGILLNSFGQQLNQVLVA